MPDMPPKLQRKLAIYVAVYMCERASRDDVTSCHLRGLNEGRWCIPCLARKWLVENPKEESDNA